MSTADDASLQQQRAKCLYLAQQYVLYSWLWMQSYGSLFTNKFAFSFSALLSNLDQLAEKDPAAFPQRGGEKWTEKLKYFHTTLKPHPVFHARLCSEVFEVIEILSERMGFKSEPGGSIPALELKFFEDFTRWKGRLPPRALGGHPRCAHPVHADELLQKASNSNTIVVMGDIRRSQDLMTYAISPGDFSSRLVEFIDATRRLINYHNGVFDKFTGDGFLAYFNEAVCKVCDVNYEDSFLNFVREESQFCDRHFQDWSLNVKKLPSKTVGLSIGADLGKVNFQDKDNHLIAVGEPIVWAARMASAGGAGDVVVNNLLYAALHRRPGLRFKDYPQTTKLGEDFKARLMTFADSPPAGKKRVESPAANEA